MKKGSNPPRRFWAIVFAAGAHLVMLLGLGWRVPKLEVQRPRRRL